MYNYMCPHGRGLSACIITCALMGEDHHHIQSYALTWEGIISMYYYMCPHVRGSSPYTIICTLVGKDHHNALYNYVYIYIYIYEKETRCTFTFIPPAPRDSTKSKCFARRKKAAFYFVCFAIDEILLFRKAGKAVVLPLPANSLLLPSLLHC